MMKMRHLKLLKNHLTCEKQWDVEELGAFSSKNKYSFIKLKNGGTYFFGAYEISRLLGRNG